MLHRLHCHHCRYHSQMCLLHHSSRQFENPLDVTNINYELSYIYWTNHVLKSVIKHFIFSVYFNKYAFLHLILLITFDRVEIAQKALLYFHQLIESFPVIYNMSRNTKKNLDSDIVDTYLHASRVFSTFLPYRPIFLYYQGDLILELVQYK